MDTGVQLYQYRSPRQYLLDWLSERQKEAPEFSVRRWAREMNLSHSLLVLLLQGKRPIRLKHAPVLARGLGLTSQEKLYFQALVEFDSVDTPEEKDLLSVWLSDLNLGAEWKTKEVEEFKVISHWVHMALLAMTRVKGFDGTAEDAAMRLKGRASIHEVRAAMERLLDLGLLVQGEDGKLKAAYRRTTTKDDVASRGAREYFKQIADLAKDAIEGQSVEEREIQSFGIAIDRAKLPLAKEMIRKFRTQFAEAMEASGDATDVFQMQLNFFRLTESPRGVVSREDEGAEDLTKTKKE